MNLLLSKSIKIFLTKGETSALAEHISMWTAHVNERHKMNVTDLMALGIMEKLSVRLFTLMQRMNRTEIQQSSINMKPLELMLIFKYVKWDATQEDLSNVQYKLHQHVTNINHLLTM